MKRKYTERGSVLFMILLAVALFAALSYAVTNSVQGPTKDGSSENANVGSAAILQFLTQLDSALTRMQLVEGVRPENISFEYLIARGNGSQSVSAINTNCANDSCRIFKPSGGNIAPITFQKYANPNSWLDQPTWPTPGHFDFYMMRWPGAGTNSYDVIMRIIGLNPSTCNSVNTKIGQTTVPTVDYSSSVSATSPANWDSGGFICTANCNVLLDKNTYTQGSTVDGGANQCIVYHLLIAR